MEYSLLWGSVLIAFAAQSDFKITTDVNVVLLDVAVRDAKGGFVSGLNKDNFKVFEDGKEQKLKLFGKEDEPVTVGIIVDNSGSMRPKRLGVLAAARAFLGSSNPADEEFVVNFNDDARLGLPPGKPFSSDPNELQLAMEAKPPEGRTALYDAILQGLEHLKLGNHERKTLIVISDGGDNASRHHFDDVLKMAQEGSATIYTIGLYDPEDHDRNPRVLKRLANETGGEMYEPVLNQVTPTCLQIAKDIRSRYMLGYEPLAKGASYRKIRVVASDSDHPKLVVRARHGYRFEEKPQESAQR